MLHTSDGPPLGTITLSPLEVARLIDQAHEDFLRRRIRELEAELREYRTRAAVVDPTFRPCTEVSR